MPLYRTVVALAVAMSTGTLAAQEKPNLSGKWIFDHDETTAEARGTQAVPGGVQMRASDVLYKNGNLGREFTLTQDARTLKFERTLSSGRIDTATYVLDGSETQHRKPDISGQPGAAWTSRSAWQGATLVITSVEEASGAKMTGGQMEKFTYTSEQKRTFSLTPDGKLISETTSKVFTGDWTPVVRSIYKKG